MRVAMTVHDAVSDSEGVTDRLRSSEGENDAEGDAEPDLVKLGLRVTVEVAVGVHVAVPVIDMLRDREAEPSADGLMEAVRDLDHER